MDNLLFSFIIPVYNRPEEMERLLHTLLEQTDKNFEVIVVEDGSILDSKAVCRSFEQHLTIRYFFKENSGPGASRNYGMSKANGSYFLILDSDCLLPSNYLEEVRNRLQQHYTDIFGGPDKSHPRFSVFQKAVNEVLTSPLSTGGVRGGTTALSRFQPRSFNMGISRRAFKQLGGFGNIHPGEDPDFVFRAWNANLESQLISAASVYHERRINMRLFAKQIYKFGSVRPILNKKHPKYTSNMFLLPTLFTTGLLCILVLLSFELSSLGFSDTTSILLKLGGLVYLVYTITFFIHSLLRSRSLRISLLATCLLYIQFVAYALGYIRTTYKLIGVKLEQIEERLPEFFFKNQSVNSAHEI